MRLMRWVECRLSGRKAKQKYSSTTCADDQFVYHPSPFRQSVNLGTPSHLSPPKLHHQLEERLNEQLRQRLSVIEDQDLHLTDDHLNFDQKNLLSHLRRNKKNVVLRRAVSSASRYSSHSHNLFDKRNTHIITLPNSCENSLNSSIPNHSDFSSRDQMYDCSSSFSNGFIECATPTLGKQRSRIKTNPWLRSPWISSENISQNHSLNNNAKSNLIQVNQNKFNDLIDKHEFKDQFRKTNLVLKQESCSNFDLFEKNPFNKNINNQLIIDNETVNNLDKCENVKLSLSSTSTSSSDSGCRINTSSIDASFLSSDNFNENLMNSSILTKNFLTLDELIDDDNEQILTISHFQNGQKIINQTDLKNYFKKIDHYSNNFDEEKACNFQSNDNDDLVSTVYDEISDLSRAESQLSAIYQQIDELKQKIDEIDLDNNRIEAKMNSLASYENKNNYGKTFNIVKKKELDPQIFNNNNHSNTNNSSKNNFSDEETITSSYYSPVSCSSLSFSPNHVVNNDFNFFNKTNLESNSSQTGQDNFSNAIYSINSFSEILSSTSSWSLASVRSSQNISNKNFPIEHHLLNQEDNFSNATNDDEQLNNNWQNAKPKAEDEENPKNDLNQAMNILENYFKKFSRNQRFTYPLFDLNVNEENIQKLTSDTINTNNKKVFNSLKFLNNRHSFISNSSSSFFPPESKHVLNKNLMNYSGVQKIKSNLNKSLLKCNEVWVSTATDLMPTLFDEENESKDEQIQKDLKFIANKCCELTPQKQVLTSNKNTKINQLKKPKLFLNCTSYNSDKDANTENLNVNRQSQNESPSKSKSKKFNNSRLPKMKPIIKNQTDIFSQTSPSFSNTKSIKYTVSNIPKKNNYAFKKIDSNDTCFNNSLNQQLKYEAHSSKTSKKINLNSPKKSPLSKLPKSFNKPSPIKKNKLNQNLNEELLSPPSISSDSGLGILSEQSTPCEGNHNLIFEIENLRLELRDVVKVAMNEIKCED